MAKMMTHYEGDKCDPPHPPADWMKLKQDGVLALARSQGQKADAGKLPVGLISTTALRKLAAVLQFGAQKYAAHNWRKGIEWQRTIDAALRHLMAYNNGEDIDPESGLSHAAHAMCNLMFLLEWEETHRDLDNRYKTV